MLVNELYQGGIRALIAWDSTLFDNMTLPTDEDGVAVTSIDDIVDTILFKFGDAPLFCPDPAVMKFYITKWSARRQPQWNRFYAAITAEYDPLENYDRHEKVDDDLTHGLKVEGQVSADNAGTYQPSAQSINSGKDQRDIESRIHGNIGVTTSQQMLEQELLVSAKLNVYNYIMNSFKDRFCLEVY